VAQANGELMRPLRGLPATHCPLAPLANNTLQATILPANSHALRALRVAGRITPELAVGNKNETFNNLHSYIVFDKRLF